MNFLIDFDGFGEIRSEGQGHDRPDMVGKGGGTHEGSPLSSI